MNLNFASTLLKNKHTSGAGIAYLVAEAVAQLGPIWFPHKKAEIAQTTTTIKHLLVPYALIMAGDASTGQKQLDDVKKDVAEIKAGQTGFTDKTSVK